MRSMIAAALGAALLLGAGAAHADKRVFIVANNGDGYGVDRCLAAGAACGEAAANSYCRRHEYGEALSYRKVDRDDNTGAIRTSGAGCRVGHCDDFVAIVWTR